MSISDQLGALGDLDEHAHDRKVTIHFKAGQHDSPHGFEVTIRRQFGTCGRDNVEVRCACGIEKMVYLKTNQHYPSYLSKQHAIAAAIRKLIGEEHA